MQDRDDNNRRAAIQDDKETNDGIFATAATDAE